MNRAVLDIINSAFIFVLLTSFSSIQCLEQKRYACITYLDNCFDDNVELLWDSPIYYRFNVWAVPDNKIAWYVFDQICPRWSNRTHRDKIESKLKGITLTYGLPSDSEGMPLDFKHDPLFGVPFKASNLNWYFNQSNWFNVYNQSGYSIKVEVANGSSIHNWEEYADLCLLRALSDNLNNRTYEANYYFNRTLEMWDGVGLYDYVAESTQKYETYKLALLFVTASELNRTIEFKDKLIERIWKQQNPFTGGIHTHFLKDGTVWGDTNIETTSLVVWANIPESIEDGYSDKWSRWYESPFTFSIVIIMTVIGVMFAVGLYEWGRRRL